MYCPKCKQTFEEGSRRFCPTDGARLVSEAAPVGHSGILGNSLMNQTGAIGEKENAASEALYQPGPEQDLMNEAAPAQDDELLFELDDEPVGTAMDEAAFTDAAK